MPDPKPARAPLPPRWFIRLAWIAHRRLYGWTGGRLGLWRHAEPAWWLNLQAHPDATAGTVDGPRQVDKNLDAYPARRSMLTAVVVLEPRRSGAWYLRDWSGARVPGVCPAGDACGAAG